MASFIPVCVSEAALLGPEYHSGASGMGLIVLGLLGSTSTQTALAAGPAFPCPTPGLSNVDCVN